VRYGIEIAGATILVAALEDIIRSKRAARRPRDLAVPDILEKTREEATKSQGKAGGRQARKRSHHSRADSAAAGAAAGALHEFPPEARGRRSERAVD
jgi:hypothetical protein